jgi:hypothetical protein
MPGPFYFNENNLRYQLDRNLDGIHSWSGVKNLCPAKNGTSIVEPWEFLRLHMQGYQLWPSVLTPWSIFPLGFWRKLLQLGRKCPSLRTLVVFLRSSCKCLRMSWSSQSTVATVTLPHIKLSSPELRYPRNGALRYLEWNHLRPLRNILLLYTSLVAGKNKKVYIFLANHLEVWSVCLRRSKMG